jgi:hypothetical protein
MLMMHQSKLERYTVFAKAKIKTLYSMPLSFWNPTAGTPIMCFKELDTC